MFTKNQQLRALLLRHDFIIVTPISYKLDADSNVDFRREMQSYMRGDNVMWDDSPSNDGRPGDLFAFVMGQGRSELELQEEGTPGGYCQIRQIIATFSHDHRPRDIWRIPEHADRRVLVLSGDILHQGSWVELCEALDRKAWGKQIGVERYASPRQGTKRWKIQK